MAVEFAAFSWTNYIYLHIWLEWSGLYILCTRKTVPLLLKIYFWFLLISF